MEILSVASITILPVICTTLDSSSPIFWLTSELRNIEWRKGCLTTAGCAQPRFQLVLLNGVTNEKLSKSWLITPQLMQVIFKFYISTN
ncbi:unnamed protein product [Gongylonema pulchrum]|uniref:Secreted protein n=1 Tax=Gongylonema pulchrum TaxID=637853 RepID=A0A183EZ23_9BILA|nr:unnamed protein product [Gongylonema pulchrum]